MSDCDQSYMDNLPTREEYELAKRNHENKMSNPETPNTAQSKVVPQTYGEAIQKYPFIDCKNHEWDNRTTFENAVYLVEQYQQYLRSVADEVEGLKKPNHNLLKKSDHNLPRRAHNIALEKALEILNKHRSNE